MAGASTEGRGRRRRGHAAGAHELAGVRCRGPGAAARHRRDPEQRLVADHRAAALARSKDSEASPGGRADATQRVGKPDELRSLIAFGSSISGAEAYRRYAEPGIRLASEPDSEVLAFATVEPVGRTYNLLLEAAAKLDDLEALVLVHPHTEILDRDFCAKVRRALSDLDVGMMGAAGARGVRSIAWWEGEVVCGSVVQRYEEHQGGEIPAFKWARHLRPPGEVEALDGQLLVLSP